jgi:LPXTG-site transpeptidase (sortase) family protein
MSNFIKRYWAFLLCLLAGLSLLFIAIGPFLHYWWVSNRFLDFELISPIPLQELQTSAHLSTGPQIINDFFSLTPPTPEIVDEDLHYANLANWFDGSLGLSFNQTDQSYTLDIPKLNIKNALVKIGGTNLDHNLIQYETTSYPGQDGAPVIFGHSVLRQFYDPRESNSRRYMSIFSTIMTLKPGDKIYISADGVRYTYEVMYNKQVKPDDTYILAQDASNKFLKLVTCTPEGTYLMRGVVTAKLVYE